jgi:hypothetical protein
MEASVRRGKATEELLLLAYSESYGQIQERGKYFLGLLKVLNYSERKGNK